MKYFLHTKLEFKGNCEKDEIYDTLVEKTKHKGMWEHGLSGNFLKDPKKLPFTENLLFSNLEKHC